MHIPTKLPLPPGQSPFHVKGSVYRGMLRRAEQEVPGGIPALLREIDDPALAAFYGQSFLANGWYDYLPILPWAAATVKLAQVLDPKSSVEKILTEAAERHAEEDLRGVYSILLRFTSPETALARVAAVHKQYYDFASSQVSRGDGATEVLIRGWPALALDFYLVYNGAFMNRVLRLSGAKDIQTKMSPAEPDGETQGVPLVKLSWVVRWS